MILTYVWNELSKYIIPPPPTEKGIMPLWLSTRLENFRVSIISPQKGRYFIIPTENFLLFPIQIILFKPPINC